MWHGRKLIACCDVCQVPSTGVEPVSSACKADVISLLLTGLARGELHRAIGSDPTAHGTPLPQQIHSWMLRVTHTESVCSSHQLDTRDPVLRYRSRLG